MLIKAAINGGRSKVDLATVSVSPEEQAAAVVACLNAGANAIHLHVRGTSEEGKVPFGKESLYADDVARTILAVRDAAPDASIGVSTGAWILPEPERFHEISAWEVQPDFASVNFSETGAAELAKLFISRGVGVEAGLIDSDSARAFVMSGLASNCLRVLLEPQEQEIFEALQTVRAMEEVLSAAGKLPPLLLHGTEATTWPMMFEALKRGYDIRVGLEDTLVLPDGRVAHDNVELITEARRIISRGFDGLRQRVFDA